MLSLPSWQLVMPSFKSSNLSCPPAPPAPTEDRQIMIPFKIPLFPYHGPFSWWVFCCNNCRAPAICRLCKLGTPARQGHGRVLTALPWKAKGKIWKRHWSRNVCSPFPPNHASLVIKLLILKSDRHLQRQRLFKTFLDLIIFWTLPLISIPLYLSWNWAISIPPPRLSSVDPQRLSTLCWNTSRNGYL